MIDILPTMILGLYIVTAIVLAVVGNTNNIIRSRRMPIRILFLGIIYNIVTVAGLVNTYTIFVDGIIIGCVWIMHTRRRLVLKEGLIEIIGIYKRVVVEQENIVRVDVEYEEHESVVFPSRVWIITTHGKINIKSYDITTPEEWMQNDNNDNRSDISRLCKYNKSDINIGRYAMLAGILADMALMIFGSK